MPKPATGFLKEHLLPALVCIGLALTLNLTPWWRGLEAGMLDQLTRLRTHFQPPADPRIVTVGVDDDGIKDFGRWPWSRDIHGQFMASISFGNPAVVAWDILFTEPSDDDAFFIKGAEQLQSRVVFGAYTPDEDPKQPPSEGDLTRPITRIEGDQGKIPTTPFALLPIEPLRKIGFSAFCDTIPGADGIIRRVPMLQRTGGRVLPSLSLQSLMVYWHLDPEHVRVVLGDGIYLDSTDVHRRIPIDEAGRYLINYRFGYAGCNQMGFSKLVIGYTDHYLRDTPHPNLPSVEGKILLVGQMSTGLSDNGPTPFGTVTPLVLVHANTIENVLREDYVKRLPAWPVALGVLALGVLGLVFFPKRKLSQQALFALGVPVVYAGLATALWIKLSLWIPLLWPVLGFGVLQIFMIVRQLIREQRAKQQIKGMFGTYLSPTLVNRMIESGQSPQLGGHKEDVTAFFSDIQAFSTFSEIIPPDQLVELMNEYLTACTDILQEESGTLDKYIGDAVVTIFGAPLPLQDHALRACVASQRIQIKLGELREKWRSEGSKWPEIVWQMRSRIGLNSGETIVGNIGSRTRFNYTMMGDNVNLAARMESGAKSWGVYTMCTEATKNACEKTGGDRVVFRPLGRILVRGRNAIVSIYEIMGLKENVTENTRECIRLFSQGMEKFYVRDWAGAIGFFSQSLPLEPNQPGVTPGVSSNPSLVYLDIVREYQEAPPADDWNGVYVMKTK
ncbi:MAG TPA: adenylate/guanylate cyclase domain-containing protein [Rariglobus sp.]|nr:adenylate/guanylate cyclase domain-containing protein [Rariglobus sp.]